MARVKDDYRSLTGPQKAAIFMLSLGEDQSTSLFELMDDEEIRELSQIMSNLGSVNSKVVERLFLDFADQLSSTGSLVGSYDSTERLLNKALSEERVSQIMEELRGPAGRTMWDKLGNVNEAVLANYLKNEYPQTVAVVLSKIRPEHAANVLGTLPESFAMEVVIRMLSMEAVSKEILDHVEKTLRTEFMTNLARTARQDSHEMMAGIFNTLGPQHRNALHGRIGRTQPGKRRAHQTVDVHLRRPGTRRRRGHSGVVAPNRQGAAVDRAQRRVGKRQGTVLFQHVRTRGEDHARRHGRDGRGASQGRR